MQKIRIKYFHDDMEKLTYIDGKSDWIDLRAAEDVELKAGEFKLVPLGVAMELPKGYEAHVVPRRASSMKATAETTTSGSSRPMRSATQRSAGETASASSASWSISRRSYLRRRRNLTIKIAAGSEVRERINKKVW